MYSELKTAGLHDLIGLLILILGCFACPLLVWPQELFSQKIRVERGKANIDGCGGGDLEKARLSEGRSYISGLTPSLHM